MRWIGFGDLRELRDDECRLMARVWHGNGFWFATVMSDDPCADEVMRLATVSRAKAWVEGKLRAEAKR